MTDTPNGFLTVAETAALLRRSPDQIRRMCCAGELPSLQIGPRSRWLIPAAQLRMYLEAQERKTVRTEGVYPAADLILGRRPATSEAGR